MRKLVLAAAAAALLGAPAYAAPKANTTAPATSGAMAPAKKPSLMSKLFKPKANTMAPATAAPAKPAPAPMTAMKPATHAMAPAKPAAAPMMAMKPAAAKTPSGAASAQGDKMKACASQWDSLSATQKAGYNTKAKGQVGKKGKALSGYNVFSSECLKK